MDRISNLTQSRLYQRINEHAKSGTSESMALLTSVTQVIEQATWISDQVVRHMPQYTLHQKTHLFNVLRLMEELLPDETLNQLTPLECALCILAAFTHDLGMAISHEEFLATFDEASKHPNRKEYLRHRDGFSEEIRQIERLHKSGEHTRAELLEGHIRAEYLRKTHSTAGATRIQGWLTKIAEETNNSVLFMLNGIDFKERLAWIAASHNQGVTWLREHLCKGTSEEDAFSFSDSNLALPGLLLRLADYMDFDATRTPRILYRNFGIDNKISKHEWEKHLAITDWKFRWKDKPTMLRYEAIDCNSPVFEKTIREFVAGIDQEVRLVRDELATQVRKLGSEGMRYQLRLPEKVEAVVHPAKVGGKPVYIYRDIEFKLDQDEILQLLMGESLYGDPSLCIRELLQNSLDAVELRRLRLQQREKGIEPEVPTDFIEEAKLQIHVTWGKDDASGQEFIRVEDNGTGMTRRTLETYFTQIGKSFYRSPEFERERIAMRRAGLLSTPISQFGIGILSCFMLADRLEVKTCPGGKDDHDRAPYNVSISGPGSLFWLTEGTRKEQGTEITLYLKSGFVLSEEPETLIERLRKTVDSSMYSLDEPEERPNKKVINPALIAGQQVIWPTCPILLGEGMNLICLDDRFYWDILHPIDKTKLIHEAAKHGCPEKMLGDPHWEMFDWIDDSDEKYATGSRIRLIFPKHHHSHPGVPINSFPDDNLCRMDELMAFVEAQIEPNRNQPILSRFCKVVKGMYVDSMEVIDDITITNIFFGEGTSIWIDLRGEAAPRLKADRTKAIERVDIENWPDIVRNVCNRWKLALANNIENNEETNTLYRMAISKMWHFGLGLKDFPVIISRPMEWRLQSFKPSWGCSISMGIKFRCKQFMPEKESFVSHRLYNSLGINTSTAVEFDYNCDIVVKKASYDFRNVFSVVEDLNDFNLAFSHDVCYSWPVLELYGLKGRIKDAVLTAPGAVQFEKESDGQTIHFADPQGQEPAALIPFGYDLVFPLTAIPIGTLRRISANWKKPFLARSILVLPFLYPENQELLDKSKKYLDKICNISQLHVLWPKVELWDTPFAEWTLENWQKDCWTATWDIKKNIVLWAHGAHTPEEMKAGVGKEFAAFAEAERLREAAA